MPLILTTSLRDARPMHLLRLPTDSWWPLGAAAGTAGFFLLLTVSQTLPAFVCGVLAVAFILRWLWDSDRPPLAATVDVGRGVRLPVGAHGRASHSWWAMIVLIAVDMTIFVSLLYTHVHLSMASDMCPPPGAALPAMRWPLAAALLLAAGSAAMLAATRMLRTTHARGQRLLRMLMALAMICAAAAAVSDIGGHRLADLDPRAQGWSASVGMLLGYQAFHIAVLMLMGSYVLVRSWTGRLQPQARATIDNTGLMWHCVTVQGIVGALTVQLVPKLLG